MLKERLEWYKTKLNYSRSDTLNGIRFNVPRINGIRYRPNERWMSEAIRGLITYRQGVFLDCGVNTGQTLLKLKSIDPDYPYIGFEPNPACAYYVNTLIQMNQLRECTLVPAGLAPTTGTATLNLFDTAAHDDKASLIPERGIEVRSTRCVVTLGAEPLCHLLGERALGVVKIDVEGFELEVVETMHALIARHHPPVLIEFLPSYSAGSKRDRRQKTIEKLFDELDYDLYRIQKTRSDELQGLDPIETTGVQTEWSTNSDYLLAPREQKHALSNVFAIGVV
ncbi:FkbM family methyltransferase [Salinisphaera sp. SPP-AMP-43]|uniref:FkbM family methyltransferase n=1 Tax=Salinisphaera sp. SPP-AMP-43 TaxID=3121288 RepID=UPI003C6DC8A5